MDTQKKRKAFLSFFFYTAIIIAGTLHIKKNFY